MERKLYAIFVVGNIKTYFSFLESNQKTEDRLSLPVLIGGINMERYITDISQIPLYSDIKFFALLIRVSVPTAYKIIEQENIPTHKIVNKKMIKKDELMKWLESKFGSLV